MDKKSLKTAYLQQDIGILGFWISIVGIILSIYTEETNGTEYLIMFLILCVPVLFCLYKMPLLSFALTGTQILVYAIYKIYNWAVWNEPITGASYAWLVIPAAVIFFLQIFVYGTTVIELKNEILREQVEELVVIDPLTGLYNQRGLFAEVTRQMSYVKRNKMKICMMVVKLKYDQELRSILSVNQFGRLRQEMAEIAEDTLRMEDRLYAIDENGTLAVLLTCDKAGAQVVERRLKAAFEDKAAFRNIVDNTIKVETKIGYVEYDEEKVSSAMDFLRQAENEVQYDV